MHSVAPWKGHQWPLEARPSRMNKDFGRHNSKSTNPWQPTHGNHTERNRNRVCLHPIGCYVGKIFLPQDVVIIHHQNWWDINDKCGLLQRSPKFVSLLETLFLTTNGKMKIDMGFLSFWNTMYKCIAITFAIKWREMFHKRKNRTSDFL